MKTKIIVLVVFLIMIIGIFIFSKNNKEKDIKILSNTQVFSDFKNKFSKYPKCPSNLAGILTAPLMAPNKIVSLTPLGNLNPPGHTSPVDHIYFQTKETGKIPLYAPADSWITKATEIAYKDNLGNYIPSGYTLEYTLCDGLELALAEYTELIPEIKAKIGGQSADNCKGDISKPGHDKIERQCNYELNYQAKSGDLVGWVQKTPDGKLPFEVWAFNRNKLSREDIDWKYYDEKGGYPYPRAFCLFDLYNGDLKNQYYSKFGWSDENGNGFRPRTIEPLCGQVNQDITGTIQGMWFGDKDNKNTNIEFEGKGLAFIHNNIDPTIAEISIGGNFMSSGIISFKPLHDTNINREFSEVKADGKIYCYDNPQSYRQKDGGKILVQLLDDSSLNVEHQVGACKTIETFQKPFTYYR